MVNPVSLAEIWTAYLDGELDPRAAARLEREIAADPVLRERLDRQRASDQRVRQAFDSLLESPIPERLKLQARAAGRPNRPSWFVPAAIAASLVVGLLVGRAPDFLAPKADWITKGRMESPLAGAALEAAFSTIPSGQSYALSERRRVIPVRSFYNQGGELCRQFAFIGPADHHSGVACRARGGRWKMVALTLGEPRLPGESYVSAVPAAPVDADPVSALVNRMMTGRPLTPSEEATALAATAAAELTPPP